MTEYASLDDLTADVEQLTVDVPLPSGGVVKVRGLSRYEWFLAAKLAPDGDGNVFEVQVLAMGMVTPSMSVGQVEKWRNRPGSTREISAVSDKIRELTGVDEGADKSNPGATGE